MWNLWAGEALGAWCHGQRGTEGQDLSYLLCPGGETNTLLQRAEAEAQLGEEVEIVCGGLYGNLVD